MTPERIEELRELFANYLTRSSDENKLLAFASEILDAAAQLAQLRAILDRVRPLEAAATPGPWTKGAASFDSIEELAGALYAKWLCGPDAVGECTTVLAGDVAPCVPGTGPKRHENADLIAAARNAIAEMLRVTGGQS
jgi:hypothetical protein